MKGLLGLSGHANRLSEHVSEPVFDYEKNCLLYIPMNANSFARNSEQEIKWYARQVVEITNRTHGHALVLFPSYELMIRVAEQSKEQLAFPLVYSKNNQIAAVEKFRLLPNRYCLQPDRAGKG